MGESDLVAAALFLVSPFCAVAGLLNGLLWRIHFALGGLATAAIVWFVTAGLMPHMLFPTLVAAILWSAIGSAVAGLFLRRRQRTTGKAGRSRDNAQIA